MNARPVVLAGASRHPRGSVALAGLLCAGLLASTTACSSRPSGPDRRIRSPGTAQLPNKPDLQREPVADRYVDTSFSVAGLLRARSEQLGKNTLVTGHVLTVHRCPPGYRVCDPAPYAYLVDDLARPHPRLLVGGARSSTFDRLMQRQKVSLAGTFRTSSEDGLYFDPNGLLVLPDDPPPPPAQAAPSQPGSR